MRTRDNAKDLVSNTGNLQVMTNEGKNIVSAMVSSSQSIKDGSEVFKEQMNESLSELSKTLLVIQEIANKTNLSTKLFFKPNSSLLMLL